MTSRTRADVTNCWDGTLHIHTVPQSRCRTVYLNNHGLHTVGLCLVFYFGANCFMRLLAGLASAALRKRCSRRYWHWVGLWALWLCTSTGPLFYATVTLFLYLNDRHAVFIAHQALTTVITFLQMRITNFYLKTSFAALMDAERAGLPLPSRGAGHSMKCLGIQFPEETSTLRPRLLKKMSTVMAAITIFKSASELLFEHRCPTRDHVGAQYAVGDAFYMLVWLPLFSKCCFLHLASMILIVGGVVLFYSCVINGSAHLSASEEGIDYCSMRQYELPFDVWDSRFSSLFLRKDFM
jgi:hypothetical protein